MSVLTTSTDSITIADDAQSVAGSAGDALAWAEPVAPMRWRPGRATHLPQRGMATAEYAIGILAAICVALSLAKFVTGAEFLTPFTKAVGTYIGQVARDVKPSR